MVLPVSALREAYREIENLRLDVARLKGELAEARRPAVVLKTPAEAARRVDAIGVSRGARAGKASVETWCAPFCGKLHRHVRS